MWSSLSLSLSLVVRPGLQRSSNLLNHHIDRVTILHLELCMKISNHIINNDKRELVLVPFSHLPVSYMCHSSFLANGFPLFKRCRSYLVRGVSLLDSLAIVKETHTSDALSLTLAVCLHQLLQLCRPLDLEEHLRLVLIHRADRNMK